MGPPQRTHTRRTVLALADHIEFRPIRIGCDVLIAGIGDDENVVFAVTSCAKLALWHGQHLLAPAIYPSKRKLVAMVSRSADDELFSLNRDRRSESAVSCQSELLILPDD